MFILEWGMTHINFKKIALILLACFVTSITPVFWQYWSDLPEEYYPNFHIQEEWEQLLDYFIDVEASRKVGADLEADVFWDMHDIFRNIFDYFPQSSTNEVIYRQCEIITDELSIEVTRPKYTTFKERCYEPLGDIIKAINTKYTIKADIKAAPKKWSAPLNVTFDARESTDPSNDTIPSGNFYWWYKDIYWVEQAIWRWPVVNYTFNDPGNHVIHLTVRSSNNYSEGIFDWEESIDINVAPKAANMVVFVNGLKAIENRLLKIWSQDAERWLLVDWTATVPLWARTIVEHKWTIRGTGDVKYEFEQPWPWAPWQFIHKFPTNWVYSVILEIVDNESNRLKETYDVSISDPVATIKFKPEKWTTSSEFVFDAAASYSITSRIKTYQRTITDPDGKQIDQIESKEIKRSFVAPWTYSIKLTVTDEAWSSSYDSQQLYVWSTPPIPSFLVTPQSDWKYPSQFILDASGTFDEDVRSWTDSLTYSRAFSNNNNVEVDRNIETDSSKIRVSMQEPWIYKAKLIVEDSFWERAEVEKDIKVESTLRPDLIITPQVWVRWETITYVAKVNKPVAFYQWDFWDGKKQQSKEPKVTHEYEKAGSYEVTLQVITDSSEENEIVKWVFMWQKDMPVPAYLIKWPSSTSLQKDSTCEKWWEQHEAFLVERYENIVIDASKSANAQWQTTDLSINFHPLNDQLYNKSVLSYNFPEVWCSYVDLFVEDSNLWKTTSERIWFNVINAMPTLQNLTLTFPQSWWSSPVWVWWDPTAINNTTDIFNNASIIVKVQAKWARDPDGFISHYRWYYYPSDDPLRKEGFKITPWDVPYTTFIIPKPLYATEYAFAVEMIDNDDWKVSSEWLVWKWPIVFFPPEEDSLDVPLVTLTVDKLTTRVWEEVTFSTKSSTISERPDFESSRYFKYDFDWDGIYDIPSTKKNKISHTYTQAWQMKPKVSVYYKWRAWVWTTETLTVLKWLKPRFEFSAMWTTVLVRDFSVGDIWETSFCMDSNLCVEESNEGRIENEAVFVYTYKEAGDYLARLDVIDEFWNEQAARQHIKVDANSWKAWLLSIPEAIESNWTFEISVWNATQYNVDIYAKAWWNCYLDLDITVDSNADWDPTFDEDISCNKLHTITLYPEDSQQFWRLYYVENWSIVETDITFDFYEFEPAQSDEFDWARDNIDELLETIKTSNTTDSSTWFYKDLLINLKGSLGETNEMNSIIIQLHDHLIQNPLMLDEEQKILANNLLNALWNEAVQEVYGWTPYEKSKAEILVWFQNEDKKILQQYFNEFEKAQWNKEELKAVLDKIFTYAWDVRKRWDIDEVDFNYLKWKLCEIVVYFELPSKTCWTEVDTSAIEEELEKESSTSSKWSIMKTVLKVFLRIVVSLIIIFWWLIIIFAIKAKKQKQDDEESE